MVPDIRTLSVEGVLPSKFTTVTLPNDIRFPSGEPRFLVTSVYEEFLGILTSDDQMWQAGQDMFHRFANTRHATIIKGQPGIGSYLELRYSSILVHTYIIGKTVFLNYVLVRRLQAKLPTVYCDHESYVHIFTESGVTKVQLMSDSLISELMTNVHCCALVNIGPDVLQPPKQFNPKARKGRVVLATSPNQDHVRAFWKEWKCVSYCMPTWNWPELYFARQVQEFCSCRRLIYCHSAFYGRAH